MVARSVIAELLQRSIARIAAQRRFPLSTYRLQFHAGFRFHDAAALAGYLHALGITDCYASPYLKARPGSTHGYDISDHRLLNSEIGSEEDFDAFVRALHAQGMGQILDVVPNHMGIVGNANVWWNDVLENGQASPYAGFFDIDWHSCKPDLHSKVLLPILGDFYGKALEALQLQLELESGSFLVRYFDHRFPISPCTYNKILSYRRDELERELGGDSDAIIEYQSIGTAISHLPGCGPLDPDSVAERYREKEVIKRRLATLIGSCPPVKVFLEATVARFNGHTDDPHRLDLLDDLLNAQPYRLASWRVAADEINYRRFFDINELAALSMEKPEVFAATHELVLRLLVEGKVNGLRIDHPDGLYDPRQYLQRLQVHYILETARQIAATAPEYQEIPEEELLSHCGLRIADCGLQDNPQSAIPLYVVVEKILSTKEELPADWPVCGTTGYEFLHAINDLFVDKENAQAFNRIYARWGCPPSSFRDLVYQKKFLTMQVSLSSELNMLAHQLDRLSEKNRASRDFTLNSLRRALREIIACFEVYRTYITEQGVLPRDEEYVQRAVAQAKRRNPALSAALFDFVRDMLLLKPILAGDADRPEQVRFVGKFQQLSSPVMAKGFEDTTFYVYNRLVSLNEVGGDPKQFGSSVATFHARNQYRQAHYPFGLSASATHDTKRGEDARARINVLSEIPKLWGEALSRWSRLNKRHRLELDEEDVPDRNEEYFLYQTLLGAWPLGPYGPEEQRRFRERIQAYMQKALHEAKVHSSWVNPNPLYDRAVEQFVARVLDEKRNVRFLEDFRAFQRRVNHYGLFNALAQTLLKVASPGVPDIYQGTELWDFSLVDPDNRRLVDYERRRRLLADLQVQATEAGEHLPAFARELTETREDGRIKMYLLMRALHCRRDHPELFTTGEYHPAYASPGWDEQVCAFVRRQQGQAALAVVPRLLTRRISPDELPLGPAVWKDALLFAPGLDTSRRLRNVFTGEVLRLDLRDGQPCLPLAEVFANFPVALLLQAG